VALLRLSSGCRWLATSSYGVATVRVSCSCVHALLVAPSVVVDMSAGVLAEDAPPRSCVGDCCLSDSAAFRPPRPHDFTGKLCSRSASSSRYALTLLAGLRIKCRLGLRAARGVDCKPASLLACAVIAAAAHKLGFPLFVPLMRRARHTEFLEFPWMRYCPKF